MFRHGRIAALAIAGALVVAACSSTSDADDTETTTTTEAAAAAEDTTTTTEAEMMDDMAAHTFTVEIANVSDGFVAREAAAFAVPVGASDPAPAFPGESYSWSFEAAPGERLSFATMFVQSNDWFFAPGDEGLALFDDAGNAITGDVTDQILLWDSGTEVDQEPGTGEDQAPRQAGPDTGAEDPDATVRLVEDRTTSDYITVTIDNDGSEFTVTIENVSEDASLPTPIAPGAAAVHNGGTPLFTEGEADAGYGLEALAEDGDPSGLVEWVESNAGVTTPLAPGVGIAMDMGGMLFTAGEPDTGNGLEGLAEDGDAAPFSESTGGVVFAVPTGASDPGPLFPGQSYTFEVEAVEGQYVDFTTMFVQSNDWFFAIGGEGIPLFDESGAPVSGDITDSVTIWDAGTEVDQTPGVGADQAPRQAGPDTGADDSDPNIREVSGFDVADYITVTVTSQG